MKKKLLCFIFAFVFIFPLFFVFTGCDSNNPPPPPEPLTVQDVLTKMEASLNNNYTAKIDVRFKEKTYEVTNGVSGPGQSQGLNLPDINLKVDGSDFNANLPSYFDVYMIDGNSYSYDFTTQKYAINANNINALAGYQEIVDIITPFSIKDIVETLVTMANVLGQNNVTVTQNTDTAVLDIALPLTTVGNKTIDNFLENKNQNLYIFINQLVYDVTGQEFNILEEISNLVDVVDQTTTVGQLFEHIKTNTGIDLSYILNLAYDIMNTYIAIDYNAWRSTEHFNYNLETISAYYGEYIPFVVQTEINPQSIEQTVIADFFGGIDKQSTQEYLLDFVDGFLNSSYYSLENLITRFIPEEQYEKYESVIALLQTINLAETSLSIQVCFDTDYNVTSFLLDGVVDIHLLDQDNNGKGLKYTGSVLFTFTDYNTTTVILPANAKIDYLDLEYFVTLQDVTDLSSNYTISLNFIQGKIEETINVVGYQFIEETQTYSTTPTDVLTYNPTTKVLTINKDVIAKALTTEECNAIKFYISTESGTTPLVFYFTLIIDAE